MAAQSQENGISYSTIDYQSYLSKSALLRKKSPLRRGPVPSADDVYMTGGLPPSDIFHIDNIEMTLKDGTKLRLNQQEMITSQQYGESRGIDELLEFMTEFVKRNHNPPTMNQESSPGQLDIMMTSGTQGALNAILGILLNEGDTLLVQRPSYPTVFSMLGAIGANAVGVESNKDGIIPSEMRNILANWKTQKSSPRPRVLYVIPTGDNPRGCCWSVKTRKEVYQICREFDILILEDDAYYFTFYSRPLPPSILSLDVDGRVVRFDTFSKTIAPGMRIGYVSGPAFIIDRLETYFHSSLVSAAQFCQMTLLKMLQKWGQDGFLQKCEKSAMIIKQKSVYMLEAADKYLNDIAEWEEPTAGMFLWIKLKHLKDALPVVNKCQERGAYFVPGFTALVQEDMAPYIRMAFGFAPKEKLFEGCRILAEVIREEMGNK